MDTDKISQLKSALELSPENSVIREMYIDALIDAGRWDEADTELTVLVKSNPAQIGAKLKLAKVYLKTNKLSQGIVMLENLCDSGKMPEEAYMLLIRFYISEGNKNSAFKTYQLLKKLYPAFYDENIDSLFDEYQTDEINEPETDDDNRIKITLDSPPEIPIIPMEKPSINFSDVGGMHAVKEDIAMKIINPIKHADLFRQYGKKIGGGILMYGPPGCGKTYLARATAGEINASFVSIGINDVVDMYLGQSEKQLHKVFEYARNNAPCVLFFDEIDALGASRNDMRNNAGRNIINQFLQELDGVNSSNDGVLILGATNAPWYLDTAFKRPGRFDRIIFIPPPDDIARKEILSIQLKNKPMMDADLETVAKNAKDFTGADMKALVDQTIEEKLKTIIQTGKETPITTKDFLNSIKKIKPSSKDWFETAKNYAVYSNQSGLYDDILKYLKIK